jgi:hypothetical protein
MYAAHELRVEVKLKSRGPSLCSRALTKAPVIICPAQFGTAQDYEELVAELEARGHPAVPLDLGRFDWLKITRSIFTPNYWQGGPRCGGRAPIRACARPFVAWDVRGLKAVLHMCVCVRVLVFGRHA